MAEQTHPFTAEMKECPYPRYEEWREEAPLVWSPEISGWLVTRYETARGILEDQETFSSTNSVFGGPELSHPEFPSMINLDEPEHRSLRALVSKAFTPRTIEEAWEPRIREYANQLLDAAVARGDGTFDIVRELAYPLPVKIIAEIIGVPSDRFEQFKFWSTQIVAGIGRVPEHGYGSPEEAIAAAEQAMRERELALGADEERQPPPEGSLSAYLFEQIYDRRAHPRDDLITRLVQAEIDGRHLDDTELIAFLVLVLVAGNETTTNLINHAVRALATHPEEQARLRADRSRMGAFLEETLRWESPIQGFYRRANRDVEVDGVSVKGGDALLVLYGAANHDPAKYECPADFNGERFHETGRGSRAHLAFGAGIHYCLGANLARIEAAIAINGVLDRFSHITAVEGFDTKWFDTPFFRGPQSYVVNVEYA